ncbi:hypothetical protein LCGC14_2180940 [marine sediment metagenome]|uniref:Uncharacterized protein n=1 Tax=marine sediment metagenome TaxID=412755 RepID=A0A0F9DMC0_9ZZZZ
MTDEMIEAATRAIKEAFSRYYVEGTSDNDLHSPPYRAPWYLIDTSTAEPDVNWPGELIQEYDNPQAAYDHRERLAAQAAIKAHKAALTKAGLGIRPREATSEMAIEGAKAMEGWEHTHGTVIVGQPKDVWQAMWDAHPDKPDG